MLLTPSAIPCSLSPLISRIHFCLFSDWGRTVSSQFLDTQVPSIATEKLVLPRHARCVLSRLRCSGHSLLLSSYLFRIGRIANPSCSACGHSSQDSSHLILHCPATDSLGRLLFGDSLSLYDLWSRPWGIARPQGLHGLLSLPPSLGRGRVTTRTTTTRNVEVVYLLEYLKSSDFLEQSYDEFGIKIRKNKITNSATKLQQRLFKQQVTTDIVNKTMESPSDSNVNNDGNNEASLPKNMTLSEFQAFLKEPWLKIEEVQSVGAQIINK